MRKIATLIVMLILSACQKKQESWRRVDSNYRDRSLLFLFYGNDRLDNTFEKQDLFWGYDISLPSISTLRPKHEHLLSECVVQDKKLLSSLGNITFVKNKQCDENTLFDDRLLSDKKGGEDPSKALMIPTIENHYEIFDDLGSKVKSRWFRLNYQQHGELIIEVKSDQILDGRLYLDSNRNNKIDKNELVEILSVDDNPQQITADLEPGTYFLQITNDSSELPLEKQGQEPSMETSKPNSRDEKDMPGKADKQDVIGQKTDENLKFGSGEISFKVRFSTRYLPSYSDMGGSDNESAFLLKTNEGPVSVNDSIGFDDQADFYRFDLTEPRSLRIKLENLAGLGDADLELYRDINSDGQTSEDELVSVSESTGVDSIFAPFAAQGTWYVKIVNYQGELTYHLELSTSETHSSDLAVLSRKVREGISFEILNLGPSDARDVKVVITLSEGQEILTEHPLTQREGVGNYLLSFGQISKADKREFIISGEPGSVAMVSVESKLPDSDTSNNAVARKL